MTETKWAPGPWHVEVGQSYTDAIINDAGLTLAFTMRDVEEIDTDATAHLIAAAPELYEGLEWAMGFIMTLMDDASRLDDVTGAIRARAALAKARRERHD